MYEHNPNYPLLRWNYHIQGRREPKMGPGSAQILLISGFVLSKTAEENGAIFSGFSCNLKKKSSIFQELICQCHFDGPYKAHWAL